MLVVGDAMLDRFWFGAVASPRRAGASGARQPREGALGSAANVALNIEDAGRTGHAADRGRRRLNRRALKSCSNARGVTAAGQRPQLYTIVKLRVIGRSQQLIPSTRSQPDHEVLAAMLDDYERAL